MAQNRVEYEILIKNITGSGLDDVKKKLEGVGAKFEIVSKSAENFKTTVLNLNQTMQVLDGVANALSRLSTTVNTYADYSQRRVEAETKLQQVMRNTMGATDAEIQSIKNLTAAQQNLGVIGSGVQLAGAQELATYMSRRESLEQLIPVMNDIIAQQYGFNATQESAVNIATMMGKVFAGQTTALSRYGYVFSEAQGQILKFGNEEERAATLAEVVTESVGGVNAALAATPTGRFVQFSHTLDGLKGQIGAMLQPMRGLVSATAELGMGAMGVAQLGMAFGKALKPLKALTVAQLANNAATLANPYVAAAAAVAALGYAIYKMVTYQTQAERHQRTLNDALKDAQVQVGVQMRELDYLFDRLGKVNRGTEEYRETLKRINDLYGQYLPNQLTEKTNLEDLKKAYDAVSQAISNKIMMERKDAALADIAGREMTEQTSASDRLRKVLESKYKFSSNQTADIVRQAREDAKRLYINGVSEYDAVMAAYDSVKDRNGNSYAIDPKVAAELDNIVSSVYRLGDAEAEAENRFRPFLGELTAPAGKKTVFADIQQDIKAATDLVRTLEKELADLHSGKTPSGDYLADIEAKKKELDEARKALTSLTGRDESRKEKPVYKQGQYGYEEQEVARLREQLKAANGEEQKALSERIAKLERIISLRNDELKLAGKLAAADGEAISQPLAYKAPGLVPGDVKTAQRTIQVDSGKGKTKDMQIDRYAFDESSTNTGKAIKIPAIVNLDTSDLEKAAKEARDRLKDAFDTEAMEDALGGLSSIMRSLGNVVGDNAGKWLDWGAGVVQAIGQAIPQIMALAAAEKAKAAAEFTQSATGAMSSQSSIPVVGPWLGIAAMAAVIAAMLAIPKFAAGGLAFGPTLGMFGEYPGASSNPEVIAPLSKLRDMIGDTGMSGEVRFVITGKDLEGVLEKRQRASTRTR
jgi:uncharacterized phage-associated protein